MTADGGAETRVGGFGTGDRAVVVGLFAIGGGLLGWALPYVARWAADAEWAPFQGPLRLVGSIEGSWLEWGWPVIGALAGLAFAAWVVHSSPVLLVSDERVRVLRRGEVERVIRRDQVDGVHRRGSKVVIENAQGRELFAGDVEGDKATLRNAFVTHHYPWEGPDPTP